MDQAIPIISAAELTAVAPETSAPPATPDAGLRNPFSLVLSAVSADPSGDASVSGSADLLVPRPGAADIPIATAEDEAPAPAPTPAWHGELLPLSLPLASDPLPPAALSPLTQAAIAGGPCPDAAPGSALGLPPTAEEVAAEGARVTADSRQRVETETVFSVPKPVPASEPPLQPVEPHTNATDVLAAKSIIESGANGNGPASPPAQARIESAPPLSPAPAALPAAAKSGDPVLMQPALPILHQGAEHAVASRVVWMVQQQVQSAHIRLDPPELGTLEVRVSVDGDQATVTFSSAHGNVRESVEQAIPRLREMLGEGGLQLADVSVGHRSGNGREGWTAAPGIGGESEQGEQEANFFSTPVGNALLDCYA